MSRLRTVLRPIFAAGVGLLLGLGVVALIGENPLQVAQVLFRSGFASRYDLGQTLFYAMPLILCGLSVSVAFRGGLFNIGAEGQLLLGALGATLVGIHFPGLPPWLALPFGILTAALFGAAWAGIAGALKVRRGSHEVITTIMLNFIAAALCSWIVLTFLRNPQSQNPESLPVAASYLVERFAFFDDAPVGWLTPGVILLALGCAWLFSRTRFGFELLAAGRSPHAAHTAGVRSRRTLFMAFLLTGALAGLVGALEIYGNSGKFKMDFSPGFGFTGIAVALLARGNPIGVIFAGLLFGALHKGSLDLDIETERVTREVSMVLQGLMILAVAAERFRFWRKST